ncbi:MAG TPA: response regulator transcription factor [Rugosimonospora sp.]|nr:response regulator transcription factor [Rugosimonospora sp.]
MATVLIADDDPMILDLVSAILASGGFDVSAHPNGRDAVEAALLAPPDCAVLDVAMPEMTGLEVARALRADAHTAGVPIILLTARGQWLDVASGFDAGADDYMVKPFSPRDLIARIDRLLDPTRQPSRSSAHR